MMTDQTCTYVDLNFLEISALDTVAHFIINGIGCKTFCVCTKFTNLLYINIKSVVLYKLVKTFLYICIKVAYRYMYL